MKQGVSANELWTQVPLANRTVTTTAASVVNSVQRGTISHTGSASSWTATISSVDTGKSVVFNGGTRTEMSALSKAMTTITLTNATTVTAQTASTPDDSNGRTTYEVLEYT